MLARLAESWNPTGHRYERKFLVDSIPAAELEALIINHPCGCRRPHPPRFVNNLYLDSPGKSSYYDNINGQTLRVKVRIRWYGDLLGALGRPQLELKLKKGLVGSKVTFPLPDFRLERGFDKATLTAVFQQSDLPTLLKTELRSLELVLMNRYFRKYFALRSTDVRVTLDAGLEYFALRQGPNSFVEKRRDFATSVVELKYKTEVAPTIHHVTNVFPFRMTRSSKYVSGVSAFSGEGSA